MAIILKGMVMFLDMCFYFEISSDFLLHGKNINTNLRILYTGKLWKEEIENQIIYKRKYLKNRK